MHMHVSQFLETFGSKMPIFEHMPYDQALTSVTSNLATFQVREVKS